MKKKFLLIACLGIAIAAVYVIFTLKSGRELDEQSPLIKTKTQEDVSAEQDASASDGMSIEMKEQFIKEVEAMKDVVMEKEETISSEGKVLSEGEFKRKFHAVEGKALLIKTDGETTLRFENFETDNGPKLHIYLSEDLGADDFIDLGPIRATKGNVNYEVPDGVDTNKYRNVLVWCKPFGVLFSYAELIPK